MCISLNLLIDGVMPPRRFPSGAFQPLGEGKYERLDRPPVRLEMQDEGFIKELEDIIGAGD